ncbi:glycosyltransferase [Herbidospora cretacea]|uniref:glycosyltransferase n=1 Tax=Herbidospora cretacea TaxID=28444 RepID=UPI000A4244BD|nr:glycosyltransferase [Herbidospora cretacea]
MTTYRIGFDEGGDDDLDGDLRLDPEAEVAEVTLLAKTPTDLRRAMTLQAALPKAAKVSVVVAEAPPWFTAPNPSLTPAHRWRALTEVRTFKKGAGWQVDVTFNAPTPSGRVVAAVARAFAGNRLEAIASPVPVLAGPGAAHWRPGDPNAALAGPEGPTPIRIGAPAGDLVVRTDTSAPWTGDAVVVDRPGSPSWEEIGRPGGERLLTAGLTDPALVPPVDDRSVNPIGFVSVPTQGVGELTVADDAWVIRHDGAVLTRIARSGAVTVVDVNRVRRLRGVTIDWRRAHTLGGTGPLTAVRIVAGLAAAGVPLVCDHVPAWAGALGPGLVALLGAPEGVLDDDLTREEHSIRLRRRALRDHGVKERWARLGAVGSYLPTTSILLATRRPDQVAFALEQAGRQREADLEVVLALHGVPREHPGVAAAIEKFDRPLTVYQAPHAQAFGSVLNAAAERASGSMLLKMDDDDWYGPDFLADLLLAHSYSGADVMGTSPEFVYLAAIDVTVHHQQITEQVTNFIAGGTILATRSAFDAVGGFRPLPRSVDTQFQHAVQAAGGTIYRGHGLGYILRRGKATEHTWREPIGTFLKRNKRQWRGFRPNALMELPGGRS